MKNSRGKVSIEEQENVVYWSSKVSVTRTYTKHTNRINTSIKNNKH